jgi:hypothetical protein
MSPVQSAVAALLTADPPSHPDAAVWELLRLHLPADGLPAPDDLRALIDLRAAARGACPGFDERFFPLFKRCLLADGWLSEAERWAVLRIAYGGGEIDPAERQFLDDLRQSLPDPSPEFLAAYDQAVADAGPPV